MFLKEMKFNFKSFLIWTVILIGIFLIVYMVYPYITSSDNIQMLNEMMNMFPKELLKVFNMDIASIDSAYGWLKSEGMIFILLIIGVYAGIIGSNILLKEESEKTIEYLNSLPIKRSKIVISKYFAGLVYIVLMIISLTIFNYIGLSISGDFNQVQFILLSVTPILSSIVIYSLCLFLSTFFHKTKKMLGISWGIVFLSYIMQALSEISNTTQFLKYFSIFTISDIRNVIINEAIEPIMLVISLCISILLLVMTIIHYENKDLI